MEHSENLAKLGYAKLNEMQDAVINEGLLESNRAVLSAPTASGKTLISLLWMLRHLQRGKKTLYVVPLRALASEKYREFTEKLTVFDLKVGISTGELDSGDEKIHDADIAIVTSEKLDSLLTHSPKFMQDIESVVIDECHLIGDEERGATLEVVLTKLHRAEKKLLGLSATIPNAIEISNWLNAKLYTSTFRPTKLVVGVGSEKSIIFKDTALPDVKLREKKQLHDVVQTALGFKKNAQALVFVSSRRSAEATARELGAITGTFLSEGEKFRLRETSNKALKALATPTEQCKALSQCLANGVAFHHAGITPKQRDLIETAFKKEKMLKAIVCTTTLAMGIDYPATWVVVKDLKRFNGNFSEFIPAMEVQQMLGRSGRPNYDDIGIGVMLCNSRDSTEAWERYVYGKPENLYSKLANETALRFHCLSLVSSGYVTTTEELSKFFASTFYAFQYGDELKLKEVVNRVCTELKEFDFIREKSGRLSATPVGRRIAELYIDPLTGAKFLEFIKKQTTGKSGVIDYLYCLCEATEMRPLMRCKKNEEKLLYEDAYGLLSDFPAWDAEALDKFKTAKLLNAWINEATEEQMLEEFEMPPGILLTRKKNAEWLAYALRELAFLENRTEVYREAKHLRRRIKHGIKAELLDITKIRGIGRVRGRRLWNAGVKTEMDYTQLTKEQVKNITSGKTLVKG
ncbi:MAG: DEAD/DEAH box helicase [Candidatus Micrarchaeota archaeon]